MIYLWPIIWNCPQLVCHKWFPAVSSLTGVASGGIDDQSILTTNWLIYHLSKACHGLYSLYWRDSCFRSLLVPLSIAIIILSLKLLLFFGKWPLCREHRTGAVPYGVVWQKISVVFPYFNFSLTRNTKLENWFLSFDAYNSFSHF